MMFFSILLVLVAAVVTCYFKGVLRTIPALIFWMAFAVSCASLID